MSLTLIKRGKTFYVRGTISKQRVYESTGTADPKRAEEYRAHRESELWKQGVYGTSATASFLTAVRSYLETEPRHEYTKVLVGKLVEHFADTPLRDIDQEAVDRAYKVILRPDAAPATKLRSVLTPLRAIMEHAAVRKWCERPAFKAPRQTKARTAFLRPEQATALVQAASPHLRPLLVFLIGTGARMSEALELDWSDVDLAGARAVLQQKQGTERHADLPPVVVAALSVLTNREGRVFRPARNNGKTLGDAYRSTGRAGGGQIKTGFNAACYRAGIPGVMHEWKRPNRPGSWKRFAPEISPHGLRHTWASWHYCVHRDLLRLRDDGGWETTGVCERYAKKMPDSYREAIVAWWQGGAANVRKTG